MNVELVQRRAEYDFTGTIAKLDIIRQDLSVLKDNARQAGYTWLGIRLDVASYDLYKSIKELQRLENITPESMTAYDPRTER